MKFTHFNVYNANTRLLEELDQLGVRVFHSMTVAEIKINITSPAVDIEIILK
jgi:hypothetical protein